MDQRAEGHLRASLRRLAHREVVTGANLTSPTTRDGRDSNAGALIQSTGPSEVLRAGIGLRAIHHDEVIARRPAVGWFEAHSENYFGRGGSPRRVLAGVRRNYPLSLHGVGLSIGSTDPLDATHL